MFIQRLRVEGLLSFARLDLALGPLNVLIGANGTGKSNLIDVISLLQVAPTTGMVGRMRQSGGVGGWFHFNGTEASLEVDLRAASLKKARYRLDLARRDAALEIAAEKFTPGSPVSRSGLLLEQSALSAERKPGLLIADYGRLMERIGIYRYLLLDPRSSIRAGADTGSDPTSLSEYGENLAMVLHHLDVEGHLGPINSQLKRLGAGFDQIKVRVTGTRAYLELLEGDLRVSAARVSDGTLRFLCLMAILLQPAPPPLLCLEEPEIGLHPDAIRIVAEAIQEASQRTQLIVTTHSPELITCLQGTAEALLICGKERGATRIERPDAKSLATWLKDYSLGDLWKSGEIGGVRW